MTPSLYDLLDVDPTSGDAEIRAAWKAAIADLDPTDRRFRAYNQAAEVLLDPDRRAAHDAELAADRTEEEAKEEERAPTSDVASASSAATADGTAIAAEAAGRGGRRSVPGWLVAVLAALTLALGAVTAYVAQQPSDASVEDATRAAQAAAERAVVPVLSYDYRTLEEDRAAAVPLMTADYRKEYEQLFAVLEDNAPSTKTVVEVEVVASGVVRSGTDRAEVLVFVDRPTTNVENKQPIVYRDQVRVQLENVEGDWLVDCMITTPGGTCD